MRSTKIVSQKHTEINIGIGMFSETCYICEKLGIDLLTYMRMCISGSIQENGIPFSMKLGDEPENKALKPMKGASRIAKDNGISEMTLDEINAGISKAELYLSVSILLVFGASPPDSSLICALAKNSMLYCFYLRLFAPLEPRHARLRIPSVSLFGIINNEDTRMGILVVVWRPGRDSNPRPFA